MLVLCPTAPVLDALCYGPSYANVLVTKTGSVGATGTSWYNGTGWIMGRRVAESCNYNLVYKYASTWEHDVLMY